MQHVRKAALVQIKDAINKTCPWSGNPIQEEGLTTYKDHVVGFCNSGCRDKFAKALAQFERELSLRNDGK